MRPGRRSAVVIASAAAAAGALGGGAFAAASLIGSDGSIKGCVSKTDGAVRVIASGTKCRAKGERTLRWNQRGPRGLDGAPGPEGPRGPEGPVGPAGPTGASAASMLTGRLANLNQVGPDDDGDVFGPPTGLTEAGAVSNSGSKTLSPATAVVARDLSARFTGDVGDGTIKVTLWLDDVPTALTCTITSASPDGTCSDTVHAVSVPPSTPMSIEAYEFNIDKTTIITPGNVLFGWRATTP